ncbi:MAG TPA: polysaccharide biosynthesis/export family protein [Polyangiaceae bacterium]|jgi:polysaccharide export outer membrane protein|nr:polysaccharide biosynthesis/export family protein [Polyangiaceae bacterium]
MELVVRKRALALWFAALMLCACAASQPFVWYSSLPPQPKLLESALISPGDKIQVQVAQHPELSGEFLVGMTGEYSHSIAGLILVAGADPGKAAEIIKIKLSRFVQDPQVAVTLVSYRQITVTVVGEVRAPGAYHLEHGVNLMTALGSAGGLNDFASKDSIYLLRTERTAQRIRFRYSDLTRPDPVAVNFQLHDGDAIVVE